MPINETLFMGGGVAASLAGNSTSAGAGYIAVSSGTLYLAGGNNVTLSQNGSSVTISAGAVGAGSFTAGVSDLGNTSGNTGAVANRLVIAGGTNITLSGSNNGQSATVTISGNNPFSAGVSTGGNTAGDTKTVSNQVVLVGGTNVTLSQATAAGGATVSVIGAADQTFVAGIAGDGTTYSSGDVVFVGSNAASVNSSGAGQTLIIDVPVQTTQTQNLHNVTLAGSTSGALADISSGTMTLAGGNNIVLSQNGNAVTISALNSGIVGAISGNTSGALVTITSGTMLLFGGNNITLSQSSHSVTISGANAGGAQTGISGIVGSDASYTSGTVVFTGSGIVTVKSGTGQKIIIDASGGGNNLSVGNSTIGNTSGETGVFSNRVVLAGGNNITLSGATDASGMTMTISGPSGGGAGVSSMGNTAGTTGTVDYQLIFVGGSNVSLSQSINGSSGTITINGGGGAFAAGVSSGGNTAGDTKTVGSQVVLVGGSNITLSQATNGGSATVSIIGASGGGAGNVLSGSGNTTGTLTSFSSGTFVLAGGNNITLSQSSNTITISGPTGGGAGMTTLGNTAGTAGTVGRELLIVGGDNISLSQSINGGSATLTINGASAGTGQGFTAGMSTEGNTAGTSGLVPGQIVFVGGSNVTLSQSVNASSATLSVVGASVPSSSAIAQPVSNVSSEGSLASRYALADHAHVGVAGLNASGTASTFVGNVMLSGANLTLVTGGNSSAGSLGFSVAAQTNQNIVFYATSNTVSSSVGTINASSLILRGIDKLSVGVSNGSLLFEAGGGDAGSQSIGISNLGNTSGTSGIASGSAVRYLIAGGNNITVSQSVNGASGTVTISGPTGGGAGMGTGANTSGTSGTVGRELYFYGGNGISLSQSVTGSSASLSVIAQAPATISQWMPGGVGASSFSQQGQSSLVVFPVVREQNGSFSRLDVFGSVSVSTSSNSSYQGTLSLHAGIYTRNVSTLSLASSGSVSYTWNGTGSTSSGSLVGMRNFSIPVNANMSPGNYFVGIVSQTASTNANWVTISNLQLVGFPNAYSGLFGGATNASQQLQVGLGVFSAQTAGLPSSIAFSDLQATSASTGRPVINLMNYTA